MQKDVIQKLMDEANTSPVLKYDSNLLKFKYNIESTIRKVKKRLGALQALNGEVDYEITLKHLDEE